jgi:hypothetical protein
LQEEADACRKAGISHFDKLKVRAEDEQEGLTKRESFNTAIQRSWTVIIPNTPKDFPLIP